MVEIAALWALSSLAMAQVEAPPAVTAADYARAARMLPESVEPLVDDTLSQVAWVDAGHLRYRHQNAAGAAFMLYRLADGKATAAFDQKRLAKVLDADDRKRLRAGKLPITDYRRRDGEAIVEIDKAKRYRCIDGGHCEPLLRHGGAEPGVLSPDRRREAFVRDWNLWLRDTATGAETRLTDDGVVDYGYATDNAGWKQTDRAILVWSPDSKKIATFRQDQRKTGVMTLVSTNIGRPRVKAWKYPLAGDRDITMIERVIIDADDGAIVRLKMPPDQHRSTQCDDISCFGGWEDVQWAADGRSLAFASVSRDHRQVWLRLADAASGEVRTVFEEKTRTWFESGIDAINWRYLSASNEVLWWSQRDDWGHLYLYDLATGGLKRQITNGHWNVAAVLHVDESGRTLWCTGMGREAGRDPYYRHLYKIGLDSGEVRLLTPENADHSVRLAPDGRHFVDTWSSVDTPPVSALRRAADGATIAELARADIGRLRAAGWRPPEKLVVKGRDGRTDLYGLMYKPSHFDPTRRYPIIDYIYPGPQVGSVRGRGFSAAQGDNQALAELGFIVVAIDGMGTPGRSKRFHDAYAGNIGDNTLPDQVAALAELGRRHAYIDLRRVGIWGHSGGGNAAAAAMFRYPEVFKVGIAESGNHDNRSYEDDWAEKWQGLEIKDETGGSNYDDQANQNHAAKLKGKLFLIHGMMDDNVPPYATLLVVDALVKANKDFDLLLLPHARHAFGEDSHYVMRRRWDYFVTHLLGAQPPPQYPLPRPGG